MIKNPSLEDSVRYNLVAVYNLSDTIAAICTPPGAGGLAAIRLSGNDSWSIVEKIFSKDSQMCFGHMHAVYGFIKDGEKIVDEVIILPFRSPKSYTTEDVIEIFCHGNSKIASMILDLCIKHGARKALAGEFTFRAFVNGRIDLTEAEAVNQITQANTSSSVFASSEILAGSLRSKVIGFREKILDLITIIESSVEFPLDVVPVQRDDIVLQLSKIGCEIKQLVSDSESGQLLREGIRVSIIGEANVGKSSLLNQLLESQRAIVTGEPGTTRDTIEEKLVIGGYSIVLIDTAGIRESKLLKETEKLGIERAKHALENSDVALVVFDVTDQKSTSHVLNIIDGREKIVVGNKIDLLDSPNNQYDIMISAKFGTNIDKLKDLLLEKIKTFNGKQKDNEGIFINQRQRGLLLQCSSLVEFAIEVANKGEVEDLIADELKKAVSRLDEVSGLKVNEDVIANIFSKFCIGK